MYQWGRGGRRGGLGGTKEGWLPLPVNWRPPPPRQQSFLRPSTLGMVECVSFSGEHHRLGTPPASRLVAILRAFWALGSGRARRAVWVRTQPTHFQSYIFPPQSHISLDPIFQGGVLGQALVGRGGELSSRFQTSAHLRLSCLTTSRYSNPAKISQQRPTRIEEACQNIPKN